MMRFRQVSFDKALLRKLLTQPARNVITKADESVLKGSIKERQIPYILFNFCKEGKTETMLPFIPKLTEVITQSKRKWNEKELSFCLYGISQIHSCTPGFPLLVSSLVGKMESSDAIFKPINIAQSMMGLINIDERKPESAQLLSSVLIKLKLCTGTFTEYEIANMMLGMQSLTAESSVARELLVEITKKIQDCGPLSPRTISSALYGLKNMSAEQQVVRELLTVMTAKIRECSATFAPANISSSLYGIGLMSTNHEEVRNILTALVPKIQRCTGIFRGSEFCGSFYGLRNAESKHKCVRAVVGALISKPVDLSSVTGQTISNCLYGLRWCTDEHAEIKRALSVIHSLMKSNALTYSSQAFATSFQGLQGMSDENADVKKIIALLAESLSRSNVSFTASEIANSLYGFNNKSSSSKEVKAALLALTPKIVACTDKFSSLNVWSCMYGLRCMESEQMEVTGVLSALLPRIEQCNEDFSDIQLGEAISGLKEMSGQNSEVRQVLAALTSKLAKCERLSARCISASLLGVRNMYSNHVEVKNLLTLLTTRLSGSGDDGIEFSPHELSNSLTALTNFEYCEEVDGILRALCIQVQHCNGQFNAWDISGALLSLRKVSGGIEEVREHLLPRLLSELQSQQQQSQQLTAQNICNALVGLQHQVLDKTVESVLQILSIQLEKSTEQLTCVDISRAIQSLYNRRGHNRFVKGLINAIINKLADDELLLTADTTACSYHGLQKLGDFEEARELMAAVTYRSIGSSGVLMPEQLCMAFAGFLTANDQHTETISALMFLTLKLTECKGSFTPYQILRLVYGIQRLSASNEEVKKVLEHITQMVQVSPQFTTAQVNRMGRLLRAMDHADPVVAKLIAACEMKKKPEINESIS